MKVSHFFSIITILLLVSISCSKDDSTTPEPNPIGYVQYGTPFANMPATDDIVMYEVNIRAFSANGNLQGVTSRLDEIKALGVNVIWLMPIHPVGILNGINSPYCVKDYKGVGSEYGTLEDVRTLTTEAHNRGMAVILDWVANHTSWDNPWIQNTDWYTKNNAGNIVHPPGTNWTDVADLNFDNSEMRLAMIDAMQYWVLEANIDGFRCDYADGVPFSFWNQAINKLKLTPNRNLLFLAEGNRSDHFFAGFNLNFGWNYYSKLKNVWSGESANNLHDTHLSDYTNVTANKHILRFTTNHDESAWDATPMTIFNGKKGALAASVVSTFMGGVPLIYSGQEVGRQNTLPFFSNSAIDWNANPDMLLDYKSMMAVYTNSNAARKGVLTDFSSNDVICFRKTVTNETLLVLVNTRNTTVTYTLPSAFQNTNWTATLTNNTMNLSNTVTLEPYKYLILKN
ncbi:MAG: alpha-amylase family glycosyl hydrolase [Flavobacterium sp.]|nr:alpha-amylase family glycosyl hydrolase [Flavobacterium sp.]